MSSNQPQSREYIVNLNQKFDSQFSNINGLLDKVIDKNNYTIPQSTQNVHQYSPNTGPIDNSSQNQAPNKGVWQPYTTFASPSIFSIQAQVNLFLGRDNTYSTSLHVPGQTDNMLRTPVKTKTSPNSRNWSDYARDLLRFYR